MKVTFIEYDACFGVDLTAETKEEAAMLVRYGINRKKEIRCSGVRVTAKGDVSCYINIGKTRKPTDYVPKQK